MILACRGRLKGMSSVRCQISISVDGFVAGPNQSLENPIGEGGMRLHQWLFETAYWRGEKGKGGGAGTKKTAGGCGPLPQGGGHIMGRQKVGGGGGPPDESGGGRGG